MPSLVCTAGVNRPTHPRTEYLVTSGHTDFLRYVGVLLNELNAGELAEVVRVITSCYSGGLSWASFVKEQASTPSRTSEPRMEPAQNTPQDLREFLTGIVFARWHLLSEGTGHGFPFGITAPAWAIRELNPLKYENGAGRWHRNLNYGTDQLAVFDRAGWRHSLDPGCPTHVIDGMQNRAGSPSERVHVCEAYLFPLRGRPEGRCQGVFRCPIGKVWPCRRGHPDIFDYFNIAAVTATLVGYDWLGRRIFAAAEPHPPLIRHGGGLECDTTPGEWSPLCPEHMRNPEHFPDPLNTRAAMVILARASAPRNSKSLSYLPSLPLGGPNGLEQRQAGIRWRGRDGTPLWPDDARRLKHYTFTKDTGRIPSCSTEDAFVPHYKFASILWHY